MTNEEYLDKSRAAFDKLKEMLPESDGWLFAYVARNSTVDQWCSGSNTSKEEMLELLDSAFQRRSQSS